MDHHYGYDLDRQGSGVWRTLRDGDFEEEDVWDVVRDRKEASYPKLNKSFSSSSSSSSSISCARNIHTTASRMIPRVCSSSSGSIDDSSQEVKIVQQSAPVNIPDWSKIGKKKSKYEHDDDNDDDLNNGVVNYCSDSDDGDEKIEDNDDDVDGEYSYKIPPHEFIARRLARSHISSFSMFEGVGRTLKGRDLKKVRNAVLTKTGFLESL